MEEDGGDAAAVFGCAAGTGEDAAARLPSFPFGPGRRPSTPDCCATNGVSERGFDLSPPPARRVLSEGGAFGFELLREGPGDSTKNLTGTRNCACRASLRARISGVSLAESWSGRFPIG